MNTQHRSPDDVFMVVQGRYIYHLNTTKGLWDRMRRNQMKAEWVPLVPAGALVYDDETGAWTPYDQWN